MRNKGPTHISIFTVLRYFPSFGEGGTREGNKSPWRIGMDITGSKREAHDNICWSDFGLNAMEFFKSFYQYYNHQNYRNS